MKKTEDACCRNRCKVIVFCDSFQPECFVETRDRAGSATCFIVGVHISYFFLYNSIEIILFFPSISLVSSTSFPS